MNKETKRWWVGKKSGNGGPVVREVLRLTRSEMKTALHAKKYFATVGPLNTRRAAEWVKENPLKTCMNQTEIEAAAKAAAPPKARIFRFYADPAHGWLRVPRKLLHELGIAGEITAFSYQLGPWVYLEEDLDLHNFILAAAEVGFEWKHKIFRTNKQSRIRGYESYSAQKEE